MKKAKLLLMIIALAAVLCACGGKEADNGDVDSKGSTKVSQEKGAETFECLPEMKEASLKDDLIQIHNVIIPRDETMTVGELIAAFENSGEGYSAWIPDYDAGKIKGEMLNLDKLMGSGDMQSFYVFKDDDKCAYVTTYNIKDEIAKISECAVTLVDTADKENTYYAMGIRGNGEGIMYQDMKEIFSEYADFMKEDVTDDGKIVVTFSYSGAKGLNTAVFSFNSEDGSCISASF
ncbi:MAG: hypothetical protein IJ324_08000 [Lachnospiraceae bacterium]|nr:hypothetical protein [Lachnospiraceae bacterium]